MILLSPYVDITGTVDKNYDVLLKYNSLLMYGKAWTNELDPKDPRVSPYYGDMKGLPKTSIWVGTCDILYDESIKTYEKMKESGVDVQLHVAKDLGYIYPVFPTVEADLAREEISKFILN